MSKEKKKKKANRAPVDDMETFLIEQLLLKVNEHVVKVWEQNYTGDPRSFQELSLNARAKMIQDWMNHSLQDERYGFLKHDVLSTDTIKTLLQGELFQPQNNTRNKLARFIGYADWLEFKAKEKVNFQPQPQNKLSIPSPTNPKNYVKILLPLAGLAGLISFIFGLWLVSSSRMHDNKTELHIRTKDKAQKGMPTTIYFDYSFDATATDNTPAKYIHFGEMQKEPPVRKLTKTAGSLKHLFIYPCLVDVCLFSDDKLCKKIPLMVESDLWAAIVGYQDTSGLAKRSPMFGKWQWGDTLHLNQTQINQQLGDSVSEIWTKFRKIKRSDKALTNSRVEFQAISNKKTGGISYFDVGFIVYSSVQKKIEVVFEMPGGSYFSRVSINGKEIEHTANKKPLNPLLSVDFSNWRQATFEFQPNKFILKLDDKALFHIPVEGDWGKLVGLEMFSKGTAKFRLPKFVTPAGDVVSVY